MEYSFIIILLSLLFSAFFSGIEIAYYSANKLRLELKKNQRGFSSRILSFFNQYPSHFMTNTLVGNNIALVIYGIYMQVVLMSFIDSSIPALQNEFTRFITITIISTIVILIFAEFLPKAIFRANPDRILSTASFPLIFFYYLFYPINVIVVWLSQVLLKRFFKISSEKENKPVFNHYDLFHFIAESDEKEQNLLDLDTEIFKNAIHFPEVKVRECMIPRTELKTLEIKENITELVTLFKETGHSKIPVYRDNIDNVVGYTHIIDLYQNPESIASIIMPISIATESMAVSDLLKQLIQKQRSMAVVVDEFGGTSGIITLEDIIEEIFGEIKDEHDSEEFVEKQLSNDEFLFSARLEVDYLNQQYNLNLPEGDYETLGGLILAINENIPEPNEVIQYEPYEFTISKVSKARIEEVRLIIREKLEDAPTS